MSQLLEEYTTAGGNLLVPPKVTAEILGISPETLRWWRHKRRSLPWVVVGGRRVMYRKADIEAFVSAGRVDPQEAANG
ncbi:helix-turn-helix transcriptional regulator [Rhizobium ruizarguesonis]